MRRLATLMLLVVAAVGCDQLQTDNSGPIVQGYREVYLARHPDTPPEIAAAIRQGKVVPGMTPQQAMAAWNDWAPLFLVARVPTANGTDDQYIFRSGSRVRVLHVRNGRVFATDESR
ncbi:MAG: hypothetical protein IRZ00_09600 [Gemmatimonadetes bacterium]|nr:hypothetical protein [Gemmatimonadota bacterium]